MANQDPNEASNLFTKTIKLKRRTLKPYEKKFVRKGEYRYDVPIQSSIPSGQPTVCYARNAEGQVQIDQQAERSTQPSPHCSYVPTLTCSQPPDLIPRTCNLNEENEHMSTDGVETENEAFLNEDEWYIHLLKIDKGISIFPGVNGPGSVLVFKDFCMEKQKLMKEKWILVERKCVSFINGQFSWIYWCTCNEMITRQICVLDSVLNTSKEDFLGQYPDCYHVRAARKIHEKYDHINSIEPSADVNYRQYQDHENYTTRNTLYEVPDSRLICFYSAELQRFGLVELKNQKFLCVTCKTYSCQHALLLNRLRSSGNLENDINFQHFINEIGLRGEDQKRSYQPKLLSYLKISYYVTDRLTETLHKLKNGNDLDALIPDETTCRHCGNDLAEGDPQENGWVAYDSVAVITNTNILYFKAYYRPCTSCESVSFFEGQSKCLLNCGTFLVGYDVLRSYMHSFLHGRRPLHTFYETFCDIHLDYGNSNVRDVFSYQRMRYAWLYFMDLLDIDFMEGFSCPECGGDNGNEPTMVICDGTSISFQRRMWQWDDLKNEPLKKLNKSSFWEKIFIEDPHTRKLLQKFAAGGQYMRGKILKTLDGNEKKKLLLDIEEISKPLYDILKKIEGNPQIANAYEKLLLSLASPSPVCSYLHPTTEIQNILVEISKETEVRQNPNLINKIHNFIPIIFDIIKVEAVSDSLKLLLHEIWDIAIDPFVNSEEDTESVEEIMVEEMSFFPSLSKRKNRGMFEQDRKTIRKNSQDCSKTYRGHPSLLPGIFTIFCPHGVCYGFQVMQTNESPDVPFTIFRTRFKKAPRYIIYDNACKLHAYCLSRDPQFFKDTEFYVDRLHWENHTSCSYGYNLSLYPQFSHVNSQLSEQSNAGLKRIKDQLSYMTANNFMKHCTFYLWKKNIDKLKIP